jgi:hypothetical protein
MGPTLAVVPEELCVILCCFNELTSALLDLHAA